MEQVTLTRKDLYDLVWSQPLLTLSKKYDISDTGLRKMCTRLEIPLPRAGHWPKLAHSKRTWIGEFKENKKLDAEKIILQFRDINKPKEKIFKPSSEDYPGNNFQVEKTLLIQTYLLLSPKK